MKRTKTITEEIIRKIELEDISRYILKQYTNAFDPEEQVYQFGFYLYDDAIVRLGFKQNQKTIEFMFKKEISLKLIQKIQKELSELLSAKDDDMDLDNFEIDEEDERKIETQEIEKLLE